MTEVERAVIEAALKETRGNRRRAAELLGIGERTLYRKIKEYRLPELEFSLDSESDSSSRLTENPASVILASTYP